MATAMSNRLFIIIAAVKSIGCILDSLKDSMMAASQLQLRPNRNARCLWTGESATRSASSYKPCLPLHRIERYQVATAPR